MMDELIDAATLTPEERREKMPKCAKFLDDMRKQTFTFEEIHFVENGYEFMWRKAK